MAKQKATKASPKKEPVAAKATKTQKILKRKLTIAGKGGGKFMPGTQVTPEMEQAWIAYYKRVTGGPPIRSIDWYC